MKYEIKGSYKYIVGILALVLILITGLYAYESDVNQTTGGGILFMGLSIMILFGTALATFLFIVGSFRKELYDDRGYLTFTLPLTGNQIVGSKLIVALLWFFILGIVIGLYNIIMAMSFSAFELNVSELFAMIIRDFSLMEVAYALVVTVFSGVNMLILIYFSMALSKVTFRNKKIGNLWFVIFLVLSGILTYGQFVLGELLPFYIDLNTFKVGTMEMFNSQFTVEANEALMTMNLKLPPANIAASIYSLVTTVALFLGTGYLIEKKIDL